jgi:hypothetical protein
METAFSNAVYRQTDQEVGSVDYIFDDDYDEAESQRLEHIADYKRMGWTVRVIY